MKLFSLIKIIFIVLTRDTFNFVSKSKKKESRFCIKTRQHYNFFLKTCLFCNKKIMYAKIGRTTFVLVCSNFVLHFVLVCTNSCQKAKNIACSLKTFIQQVLKWYLNLKNLHSNPTICALALSSQISSKLYLLPDRSLTYNIVLILFDNIKLNPLIKQNYKLIINN